MVVECGVVGCGGFRMCCGGSYGGVVRLQSSMVRMEV